MAEELPMTKIYNYTKKTGRPSKYNPSFVNELDNYLATTGKEQTSLPTRQGFALWLGVDDDTLTNWGKEHEEFFGALKKLMLLQGEQLINDGIYGGKEVNATIVKLLLQNNHGMKERTDMTTNDKELPIPILNALHNNDSNQEAGQTKEED